MQGANARRVTQHARRLVLPLIVIGIVLGGTTPGVAGTADVVKASGRCSAESKCRFVVTIRHADVGMKHYADRYEILGPDGIVLGTRILRHPHVHEQPFTRNLEAVEIPPDLDRVVVRAHDSLHGYGGRTYEVELERPAAQSEGPEAEPVNPGSEPEG